MVMVYDYVKIKKCGDRFFLNVSLAEILDIEAELYCKSCNCRKERNQNFNKKYELWFDYILRLDI